MSEQARSVARMLLARHGGDGDSPSAPPAKAVRTEEGARAGSSYFADHPDVVATNQRFGELDAYLDGAGLPRPYFSPHVGPNSATVHTFGRRLINFSSFDYLGMSADSRVQERAKAAIDRYGTSVSASRVVSGEIPLHGELETRLARFYGVDDAVVWDKLRAPELLAAQ